MKTSSYPYCSLPFQEFNTAQKAVVPFFTEDVNLVVSFNTSVGKTAIGKCVMGYHLSKEERSKVVYVSPYKGISEEKYKDWSNDEQFANHGVLIDTGDHNASFEDFEKSRIIIITSESFDSKTRSPNHRGWIRDISCVVVDEAHLVGHKSRGSKMEAFMMKITKTNPNARIVLLSATMSNANQMAKWIKSLNKKETKCISSDWRPVEIKIEHHSFENNGRDSENNKISKTVELVKKIRIGQKVIVFVHSKITGKKILKELQKEGIVCAFHNSSVTKRNRAIIEARFDDPYSGLDVLISTSTLSAGVNIGG